MAKKRLAGAALLLGALSLAVWATATSAPRPETPAPVPEARSAEAAAPAPALPGQSTDDMQRKSEGCVTCHTATDSATMHESDAVRLGCADCHGGDAGVSASGLAKDSKPYDEAKTRAHVEPRELPTRCGRIRIGCRRMPITSAS
jgi:hypothetical protein